MVSTRGDDAPDLSSLGEGGSVRKEEGEGALSRIL